MLRTMASGPGEARFDISVTMGDCHRIEGVPGDIGAASSPHPHVSPYQPPGCGKRTATMDESHRDSHRLDEEMRMIPHHSSKMEKACDISPAGLWIVTLHGVSYR
jgi:hypothetical protein